MRRLTSFLGKALLVYSLVGFLLIPTALHFGIYYFSPRFLVEPLRIGAVHFNPFTLKLSLQSLLLGTVNRPLAGFRKLTVDITWSSLRGQFITFDAIHLKEPYADIRLLKDGQVNLAKLLQKKHLQKELESYKPAEPESDSTIPVFLEEVTVQGGYIKFFDEANAAAQPFRGSLAGLAVTGQSISWPRLGGNFSVSASVNKRGKINLEASVEQGAEVIADIRLKEIFLPDFQPYLSPLTYLQLEGGNLTGRSQVIWKQAGNLTAVSGGEVHSLKLVDERDQEPVAEWKHLAVGGISFNQNRSRLKIDSVQLDSPEVRVIIDKNMQVNLTGLIKPAESELQSTEQTGNSGKAFEVDVNSFQIKGGVLDFSDTSFKPGFSALISGLSGDIQNLHTHSDESATVRLDGAVDNYSPVTVSGVINTRAPLQRSSVKLDFKDVELTTLTPYSGRFAGYRLEKGRMDLNLDYTVADSQLTAENQIRLMHLILGERVESENTTSLPLKLAVALLKDSKGEIDIDIPVSGDLDNPDFEFGPVIRTAVVNFISNVVTAPFKLLASLVAGNEDEMSSVVFAPGLGELAEQYQQPMDNLVKALRERPQLELEIESWAVAEVDGPVMAGKALEEAVFQEYLKLQEESGFKVEDAMFSVPKRIRGEILRGMAEAQGLEGDKEEDIIQELRDLWPIKDRDLRALAISRARAVKDMLVEKGLEANRVYILDVKTGDSNNTEKNGVTTVLNLTAS